MITYLSPYGDGAPAMAIEVPLVLVWQAQMLTVRTHQWGRTLEYLKLEEIPWVIHGIDLSQGSHGLYMGLN